jgi:hypothetical protein
MAEFRGKLLQRVPRQEQRVPLQTPQQQERPEPRLERRVPELKTLKLGAQQTPPFDGSERNYTMFRRFWIENVEKQYTESAQYAYLMEALPSSVKKNLTSVAKDVRELWEQLEVQYGTPEVMGRQVSQELFELDPRNYAGGEYIIELTTMLEETEVLLLQHHQLDWLTSPNAISQLEEKLPYEAKKEWTERMNTFPGTKYERLKAFLNQRRLVAEKMKSIGVLKVGLRTPVEGAGCTERHCTKKGHKSFSCPPSKKTGGEKDNRTCFKCGKEGDIAKSYRTERSSEFGRECGKGRGAGES